MALPPDVRARHDARVLSVRGLLKHTEELQDKWRYDPPLGLPQHDADLLALDDHLKACEELLRVAGVTFTIAEFGPVYVPEDVWRGLAQRIAALLGSDAAEGEK